MLARHHHVSGMLAALAGTVLATIFLIACDQSQRPTAKSVAAPADTSMAGKIYVQFEGPWAFVPDPQDPNGVVAIAPKTTSHHDLYVKASNDMTLAAGVYALSVPAQSMTAGPADPAFVHFNIPTTNVQQALAASGTRYAIRIPKPEAYFVAGRSQSRYGSTYPPTSNQGDHATAAALRYTVPSTSWISVTGTTDTGPFNTFLLQVDTPFIRFVIDPAQADDPADTCDTHSRTSFSELTGLLAVGLYVDFPGYSAGCQGNDIQQKSRVRKRSSIPTSLFNRMAAAWNADLDSDTRRAGMSDDGVGMFVLKLVSGNGKTRIHALSSMLFFAHGGMDCKAPIITSP